MGLKQLFNRNKEDKIEIPQTPIITKGTYNTNWLSRTALAYNIEPSDNVKIVAEVLHELEVNNGQCPHGDEGVRYKCPCVRIRENNICICGLFKSIPPRKISGSYTANIRRNDQ